jgi:hypothetical protein
LKVGCGGERRKKGAVREKREKGKNDFMNLWICEKIIS